MATKKGTQEVFHGNFKEQLIMLTIESLIVTGYKFPKGVYVECLNCGDYRRRNFEWFCCVECEDYYVKQRLRKLSPGYLQ